MIRPTERWKEVVARLVAALLVLGASGAIAYRPGQVLAVSIVDFSERFLSLPEMQSIPIAEFVKQEASRVSYSAQRGPEWEALVLRVEEARASSEPEQPRRVDPEDEEVSTTRVLPLFVSDAELGASGGERLVAVDGSDGSRVYLQIVPVDPRIAAHEGAPLSMTRPWLFPGIAAAVLALLVYVALRWRRAANAVAYRFWIPALADAFGFAWLAAVGTTAARIFPDDPSSGVLGVSGGLAVASPMLLMGAYFACQRIVVEEPGIRYVTLFGVTDIPYERIAQAGIRLETGNKLLALVLIAFGVTNCLTALFGISMLVRRAPRVALVRDDGRTFGLWVSSSRGVDEALVPALAARGKWIG